MSSQGKATPSRSKSKPKLNALPAPQVRAFRASLDAAMKEVDDQGRKWTSAKWGVYAFFDYDGEPIYVGQTNEKLSVRVRRHLTNQRTDSVAMRILDPFEVAEVEVWPIWDLQGVDSKNRVAKARLNAYEYAAYVKAIRESRFQAILNEKIPPVSDPIELPASKRWVLATDEVREERAHPDIRIARRAETIARLAAVAHERGAVSIGLRRVLVIQAIRLAYLSAVRLAYVEGRAEPDPASISVDDLVGSVLYDSGDSETESDDEIDGT